MYDFVFGLLIHSANPLMFSSAPKNEIFTALKYLFAAKARDAVPRKLNNTEMIVSVLFDINK